jgi:hypothetical protein
MRWIRALVDPPIAIWAVIAFSKEAGVRTFGGKGVCEDRCLYSMASCITFEGRTPCCTSSTIRLPELQAMRMCEESIAGMDDAPGRLRPAWRGGMRTRGGEWGQGESGTKALCNACHGGGSAHGHAVTRGTVEAILDVRHFAIANRARAVLVDDLDRMRERMMSV